MALDEPKKDEKTIAINGLEVLIDAQTFPFIEGSVIDYIDETFRQGFIITPPDGRGTC